MKKWLVLVLLCGAYFFHQADRAIFGVLTPEIERELGLTDQQFGWINLALSWTIAIVTPCAGVLAARLSRKWIITSSILFWSVATSLIGLVGHALVIGGVAVSAFALLMILRAIAVGGGESFYGPAAMALLGACHRETRSLAFSIHQAALYLGLMLSGVIVAWALGALQSWRCVFVLFGAAGILLGILFIFLLPDPSDAPSPSAAPRPHPSSLLGSFFRNPSALLATTGFIAIVSANNAYLFWGVKFATVKFASAGVTEASAKTATMFVHHLFAFGAILLGGVITDRFVKRYPRFRLGFQIVSLLCGAPILCWLGFAPSWTSFLVAGALYGVSRGFFEVNTHASVFDVIAPECRSTAVGCMLFIAFLVGGVLGGLAMGELSQALGQRGLEIGFALTGALYALAAVLMSISFFITFRRDRLFT